jgi:hypothetical protein
MRASISCARSAFRVGDGIGLAGLPGLVGMAVGWLGVGTLVAAGVLTEHLVSARRFPVRAGWWLMPALAIAWPWPVWVWYATHDTPTGRIGRGLEIGVVTIVLAGALGLGWVCGSNLYSFLCLQEPEVTNRTALNAMVERIIDAESNGSPNAKNEHFDETAESALAPPAPSRRQTGQNGNVRTASRPQH